MLFMGKHKTDDGKVLLKQLHINIALSIVDTVTVFQSTESKQDSRAKFIKYDSRIARKFKRREERHG